MLHMREPAQSSTRGGVTVSVRLSYKHGNGESSPADVQPCLGARPGNKKSLFDSQSGHTPRLRARSLLLSKNQ